MLSERSKIQLSLAAILLLVSLFAAQFSGCCRRCRETPPTPEAPDKTEAAENSEGWVSLFDGETLDGWEESGFGGTDEVSVSEGSIRVEFGAAELAGVTSTRDDLPTMNYEATLEAMRIDGNDFFCGFTFPVGEDCCSLILGGWGGSLVGISSFNGLDASENETTTMKEFEDKRWYRVTVRVTENRIQALVDGEKLIDAIPGDRKISVRAEVTPSQPFGLAAWNTRAAYRDIRVRRLP